MQVISESQKINSKLMIYGYEKGRTPMQIDTKILSIGRLLATIPENHKISEFECEESQMLENARNFLNSHFTLHDVPFIPATKAEAIAKKYTTKSMLNLYDFRKELQTEAQLISPYDIPIIYEEGHSLIGEIKKPLLTFLDKAYLENVIVSFSNVVLGNNITKLSAATYGHEMVHTQLESIKGSTKDYHNKEAITIFIEKLAALEMDPTGKLLEKSELMRFRTLAEDIALLCFISNKRKKRRFNRIISLYYLNIKSGKLV